jgi:hypothetical protein
VREGEVKLVCRKKGENPGLVDALKARGIRAKHVRVGVLADMVVSGRAGVYTFPPGMNGADLLIDVEESWLREVEGTRAQVVCGLSGKALRPYFVPARGHPSGRSGQAFFSIPTAVVLVTAYRDGRVEIRHLWVETGGDITTLLARLLWSGSAAELPHLPSQYGAAARAAIEKAKCEHCCHVHYAAAEEEP